ncbi:hypothetical protein [Kribbella sp. NPDC051770]|uniref:hypothetical protein n=1 Tax=Kribbella sp. NPDC051770 TaxID=3155413 RepID=UPI00342DCD29
MTDELKAKFQALVEDTPEPTGLPSDAVFARIKTARRRRTTGLVAGLATAAVATIALAAGNLTGIDSAPPVTETPNRPTPTASVPSSTPTSTPTAPKPPIAVSVQTLKPGGQETDNTEEPEKANTPPPSKPSSPKTQEPEAPLPVKLNLTLSDLTVNGLKASLASEWTGSLLVPVFEYTGRSNMSNGGITANAYYYDYDFGDEYNDPNEGPTGTVGSGLTCDGAYQRYAGSWSGRTVTHTYRKAGTYTFTYRIGYCTDTGLREIEKTMKIKVTGPTTSPSP